MTTKNVFARIEFDEDLPIEEAARQALDTARMLTTMKVVFSFDGFDVYVHAMDNVDIIKQRYEQSRAERQAKKKKG
jgi:hypothetical protein